MLFGSKRCATFLPLPELDQQFPAAVRQRRFVLEAEHLQKGTRRC